MQRSDVTVTPLLFLGRSFFGDGVADYLDITVAGVEVDWGLELYQENACEHD